jgi:trimeric autotransporter adhesin
LRHAARFIESSLLIAILGSYTSLAQQCAITTPINAAGASIASPGALAVDTTGKLYFTTGSCVLQVDLTSGMLTRIAGTSTSGYAGDGGPASVAQLKAPGGLAVDDAGNLYIADTGNHSVRVITPDGNITTIAGTGSAGYAGDGGPAANAALNGPQGLAADHYGDLYIADTNNSVVRKISPAGIITTYAGNGTAGYSYDGFFAREAQLNLPAGLAVSSGNLYIADSANNRVRLVTAARLITTLAGNGTAGYDGDDGAGGQAEDAELNLPTFLASDTLGTNIYISDSNNGLIRQVLPDTIITTAAGGSKTMGTPAGLALDSSGNLFIADSANSRILKLSPSGALSTVAGK